MNRIFETDRKELKKFCKTLAIAGPVLGSLALGSYLWKDATHFLVISYIFYGLSAYGLLCFLTAPILILPAYVPMTTVGNIVQWTLNTVVMGSVYFLMFTPVAIFFRMTKRDRLKIKLDPGSESYWEVREATETKPERYEKQY